MFGLGGQPQMMPPPTPAPPGPTSGALPMPAPTPMPMQPPVATPMPMQPRPMMPTPQMPPTYGGVMPMGQDDMRQRLMTALGGGGRPANRFSF